MVTTGQARQDGQMMHGTQCDQQRLEVLARAAMRFLSDGRGGSCHSDDAENARRVVWGAELHGVASVLYLHLRNSELGPQALSALAASARASAVWESSHRTVMREALGRLRQVGVEPLVMKGTALAYSIYPDPMLRSRSDSDLLVPEEMFSVAREALRSTGFEPQLEAFRESSISEASFCRSEGAFEHVVDLHRSVARSPVLGQAFTYGTLWSRRVPLNELSPDAFGPSRVDALLIACLHQAMHWFSPYYKSGEAHCDWRLIWLIDIDLLSRDLTADEWLDVSTSARRKQLAGVVVACLRRAEEVLGTNIPEPVFGNLAVDRPEPVFAYLRAGAARRLSMDLRYASTTRCIGMLADLICPPSRYMRAKYSQGGRKWLPLCYVERVAKAAARYLLEMTRSRSDHGPPVVAATKAMPRRVA